jgi:biopolymer transport protein ExbD
MAQVVEGLREGLWETTDEVMGPDDKHWISIESHPQLAETAADIEPPEAKIREDEARLDMNPLIDVALVLLIFFILTTSYAALQKLLDVPAETTQNADAPLRSVKEKVDRLMIKVRAREENGNPVFYVENERVDESGLGPALTRYAKASKKTQILIDADDDIDWGSVVAIQDAAKEAGIEHASYLRKRKPTGPIEQEVK